MHISLHSRCLLHSLLFLVMPCFVFSMQKSNMPNDLPLKDRIYLGSRASVSKDGSFFIFEWADSIWKASTDGGEAEALLADDFENAHPIISPNDDQVAFVSNRDGGYKTFIYDLKSARTHQVTFHSEGARPYEWTDGGKSLVALVFDSTAPDSRYYRIAKINTQKRSAYQIYFNEAGTEPSVSPDGKKVLFMRKGDDLYRKGTHSSLVAQIWMYDCDSKKFFPIIRRDTESRSPHWAPDGNTFYYVSGQDGCLNIWKHNLKTQKEQQITFFKDDSVIHPSLSLDGTTMVFRQKFDFYKIDPRKPAKNPKKIILTSSIAPKRPATRRRYYTTCWNNDSNGDVSFCDNGMQIAFTTGGDLFVMDTIIRTPHLIHGSSLTHERECKFTKDGRILYYLSDCGDKVNLWKAEPQNPKLQWWENFKFERTQLTHDEVYRTNLKISPTGKYLSWQDAIGRIHIADLNGKEITQGPKAAGARDYSWSPDDKWMVAAIDDPYGNSDIWIFPIDHHREPYNLSRSFKFDDSPVWSPDGKMIAFVGSRPDYNSTHLFYVWLNPQDEAQVRAPAKMQEKARKRIQENMVDPKKTRTDICVSSLDQEEELTKKAKASKKGANKKGKASNGKVAKGKADKGKKNAPQQVNKPSEQKPQDKKDVKQEPPKEQQIDVVIDFNNLCNRVHRIKRYAFRPFFSYDSNFLAFMSSDGTYRIQIKENANPTKLTDQTGFVVDWIQKGDRLLWMVNNIPAHFKQTYPFSVYQNTDIADYQELAFLTAWGKMNYLFYDKSFHGADWPAIKNKYRDAARYAPTASVFTRVMGMLLGELNASHLGYYETSDSKKEWNKNGSFQSWSMQTAHLGLIFDHNDKGKGWLVKSVVRGGPADLNAANIQIGERILSVNDREVHPGMDITEVLNGPGGMTFTLVIQGKDGKNRTVLLKSTSYAQIRELRRSAYADELRKRVHKASNGHLGYLDIKAMNWQNYYQFEEEIFSEGFDKEGMIIDVRDNCGGFVADHILNVLCGSSHSYAAYRESPAAYLSGYWGRPVFDRPIVVLCNETTASNGEIFTHAIKALKRGKVVGVPTGARVIATNESRLLDYGNFRLPSRGWFLLDGRDMEEYGAEPDLLVPDDLNYSSKGIDIQLNAAIKLLGKEVEQDKKVNPPVKLNYFHSSKRK